MVEEEREIIEEREEETEDIELAEPEVETPLEEEEEAPDEWLEACSVAKGVGLDMLASEQTAEAYAKFVSGDYQGGLDEIKKVAEEKKPKRETKAFGDSKEQIKHSIYLEVLKERGELTDDGKRISPQEKDDKAFMDSYGEHGSHRAKDHKRALELHKKIMGGD